MSDIPGLFGGIFDSIFQVEDCKNETVVAARGFHSAVTLKFTNDNNDSAEARN